MSGAASYIADIKNRRLGGLGNFLDESAAKGYVPKGMKEILPHLEALPDECEQQILDALEDVMYTWAQNVNDNNIGLFFKYADFYVESCGEDFVKAGKSYEGFHIYCVENSGCILPEKYSEPNEFYLLAAENYLQEGALRADDVIKKIRNRISRNDGPLWVRYKHCYSQIQDVQRNYGSASFSYLSTLRDAESMGILLDAESRHGILNSAAICAILDKHGPPRDAVLKEILSHEASGEIPVAGILSKICAEQLLTLRDRNHFERGLATQHLATGADGRSFVENAFIRHNVSVVSSIYKNVSLKTMADILGVQSETDAEEVITEMITKQGLKAIIDGVGRTVEFNAGQSSLETWEEHIMEFCTELENLCDEVQKHREVHYAMQTK